MHPQIISEKKGFCPICGMNLELKGGIDEDDDELKSMRLRFLFCLVLSLALMPLAMLESAPFVQFLLSLPVVLWGALPFYKRAISGLNMFTLIVLGVQVSFLYSLFVLFFYPEGHLYFETAAFITTFVLLGQVLELKGRAQTKSAIHDLLKLSPKVATLEDGSEILVEEVQRGNHLLIRPGEHIALDGILLEGTTFVDESMMTGEARPVKKVRGDKVIGGSLNQEGSFVMEVTHVGQETLLAKIIHLVSNAQNSKAPIQKLADQVSAYFVPTVILIAIITFFAWFFSHNAFEGMVHAVSVLIIACPCALGLATPMSLIVGIGRGAKMGILIKNGEALERLSKIERLVFDKTGTLTEGKMEVQEMHGDHLEIAYSLERLSEHPIGKAIVAYAEKKGVKHLPVLDFKATPGQGVSGIIDHKRYFLGNFYKKGEIILSCEETSIASFIIQDRIKTSSFEAVKELHARGITLIMLTGDKREIAEKIAREVGIEEVRAELLPHEKYEIVKALRGRVAMAGDGVNDAPALAVADVGIAMGKGSDIAIESASITLVKGDLRSIVEALELSWEVLRNIRQNLGFAFVYNILGIPMAAGLFGFYLHPMLASLAMSLSSFSVIINALRLRKNEVHDKTLK